MAGNPNWKAGGESPNPQGRRKYKNSAQTVKGKLERFLNGKFTPKELNRIYNALTPKDQAEFYTQLLPYVTPKQAQMTLDANLDRMSDQEIEHTYMQLFTQINNKLSFEEIPFENIPRPEIIQLPQPEKLNDDNNELEATA